MNPFTSLRHNHPHDGFLLCPQCHVGRWIIGTKFGGFHLLDLDRAWHVPLIQIQDRVGPLEGPAWLHSFRPVRETGTLSMRVSTMGTSAQERPVRTKAVISVEPIDSTRALVRECWRRGLLAEGLIEQAVLLAEDLERCHA